MFSILTNVGLELPLTLLLLALLGLRARVTPTTSLWINTSPEKLWALLDVYDGKVENWGNTTIRSDLVDTVTQTFQKTFSTRQPNGTVRPFTALFRVSMKQPEKLLELTREGLEGKSEKNELLKITHELTPEKNGTRLKTAYYWGSRAIIAQLLARADLWGGAYRLKGLAETGVPDERPYIQISALVAVVTGLLSLAAFALMLGLPAAFLLIIALFVHEFGHLLAYRLMGQPWGRMVFLPFLGAMAMPRLPQESQGQTVFAALMGPGFSALLAILCTVPWLIGGQSHPYLMVLGFITAALNLFNLLPAEPLDGGVALRSVFTRLFGDKAQYGLLAIGGSIVLLGFALDQIILVLFGGLATFVNLKPRKIDAGQTPLTSLQVSISALGYAAIGVSYISLLNFFINQISNLPTSQLHS
jgi:Zn-dependent protease